MRFNKARNLLALDGLGAFWSSLMLGFVLMGFQPPFQMPSSILVPLSGIAMCFAVFALGVAWFMHKGVWRYLEVMALANSAYLFGTLVLLWLFWVEISVYDKAYFIVEALLLVCLIFWEFRVAAKYRKSKKYRTGLV